MVQGLYVSLRGMGDDRPHAQGRPQQGPGLAAVDGLKLVERALDLFVESLLFGLKVGHLAAHHSGRPSTLGQDLDALQGARHRFDLVSNQPECQCEQSITRQNGRGFVKGLVTRRPPAPQVVVVHGRQVIMDQGISVNQFKSTGGTHRRTGISATRLSGHQAKHGT